MEGDPRGCHIRFWTFSRSPRHRTSRTESNTPCRAKSGRLGGGTHRYTVCVRVVTREGSDVESSGSKPFNPLVGVVTLDGPHAVEDTVTHVADVGDTGPIFRPLHVWSARWHGRRGVGHVVEWGEHLGIQGVRRKKLERFGGRTRLQTHLGSNRAPQDMRCTVLPR